MTEPRLIHLWNSMSCKSQRWTKKKITPSEELCIWTQWQLSTSTKCGFFATRHKHTFISLAQQREQGWAVRMFSQCLKTLPASVEPTPHCKLKPAEFLRITLLYNGWSLSLITGWFFPYNPTVIPNKSGCPVTPTQLKAHLNPTPFSPSKVNLFMSGLYTICVHHVQSETNLLFYSTHSLNYIIKGQPLIPGQNSLSEGSDLSNISLLRSTVLLDCNHPPPQETKGILLWKISNINIMEFFPTQ